jgi:hypothetical protein
MTTVWIYVNTSKQVDGKDCPIFGFPRFIQFFCIFLTRPRWPMLICYLHNKYPIS